MEEYRVRNVEGDESSIVHSADSITMIVTNADYTKPQEENENGKGN